MTYFTTTNKISKSVQRSNLTLNFFKAASYARSDAVINQSVSSSYILRNIFRKFSNTSASNSIALNTQIMIFS